MPLASAPACTRILAHGRYMSCWKSSSRDQVSFTGLPTAFDSFTAWAMQSVSIFRPKPPPT